MFTGRDLHTGEVKSEFKPDVSPDWFHHRCYRSKATDKYFIASRTGIEFIDLEAKHWDINHWVRGGCMYGFMPANGLVYAPPHSCGCFLESKLFGFNALAVRVGDAGSAAAKFPASDRLQRGPAYGEPLEGPRPVAGRRVAHLSSRRPAERCGARLRSGRVEAALADRSWEAELSSVVVAGGKVFVAAIDAHTVHALDAEHGQARLELHGRRPGRFAAHRSIEAGSCSARPTAGCTACGPTDGRLVWRFLAAPDDRRLVASRAGGVALAGFRQRAGAGRTWCAAWPAARRFSTAACDCCGSTRADGRKLSETRIDDRDPETGDNLQVKIKGQDMPVALPDILSSDGRSIYMRAQAFDLEGVRRQHRAAETRRAAGVAGRRPGEEPVERRDRRPLVLPLGFLDDSWFWRSYWMYGKVVDSNYSGWLRPGHFAPCGQI